MVYICVMEKNNTLTETVKKIPHSAYKIKMQCRDKNGGLLAYHNDVECINEAIGIKVRWENTYKGFYHVITINFFS